MIAFIAILLFDPSSIPVETDSASDGEAYDVPIRVAKALNFIYPFSTQSRIPIKSD